MCFMLYHTYVCFESTALDFYISNGVSFPFLNEQMRYKTWVCWSRFGFLVTALQFLGAAYLMFHVVENVSRDGLPRDCLLGKMTY